ncbi:MULTISPECIES: undecaprenyl diphosphate synthase family protein [Nitrosomonas]|uniref:Dihydroorotate dehydrogenase n=2 Tax=Nitrosomonas communis TaxID=44574 RepID=A0A0F7KHI0_9PROT|nr:MULTISPECIES: undecaprenyl diphosphate synthase family protein [Nitrosomonas]AKH38598.1 dihydroorotate dehydrogenase [Nitrosomonas communis]TYP93072.1 undecaprenyl diphosphate synthase [Nitrosomonas communis]UVS60662.1 undecaprenyl diphosphate synthase family protein [Nitrosomonas sp. PLL12]
MKSMLPCHVGFIPDGNRRWAQSRNLAKEEGYAHGILPGIELYEMCRKLDIKEFSIYGFTKDNTHRPAAQAEAFRNACIIFAEEIAARGAALLVLGDDESSHFPAALRRFRSRQGRGIKVNFLVNYGWDWDLKGLRAGRMRSEEVSRIDLIVRWGGGRRLSGFLPAQSVYADIYVVEQYWPDFEPSHFENALEWFKSQDRTLGG